MNVLRCRALAAIFIGEERRSSNGTKNRTSSHALKPYGLKFEHAKMLIERASIHKKRDGMFERGIDNKVHDAYKHVLNKQRLQYTMATLELSLIHI